MPQAPFQRPPAEALVTASALALGAETQSQGGWLWPESLRAELGLVTTTESGGALDPLGQGPEARLASALEAFWARGRARRSAASLPRLHPEASPPPLARLQGLSEAHSHPEARWAWAFAFALSWSCDDAGGALLWVASGPKGEAQLLEATPGAWPLASMPESPALGAPASAWVALGVARLAELQALEEGPDPPPLARHAAEGLARLWAEGQLEAPAKAAEARYHAAAARVVEAAQAQAMAPGPKAEALALRLRAERDRRLAELARRHALRANLRLVGLLALARPGLACRYALQGPEGPPAPWQGWWDAHAGRWEGLACSGCGGQEGPFAAAEGQVACPSCVSACASCHKQGVGLGRCQGCGEALCVACQQQAPGLGAYCPACSPTCPRCGVVAPVGHHLCPFA